MDKNDFKIDLATLDKHLQEQPELVIYYGELSANKEAERDRIKDELDSHMAKLDLEIRATPDFYGLDKATDASVKAAVACDETTIALKEKLVVANQELNLLKRAAERGLRHKRKALENLSQLFLGEYFAKPKVSQEARQSLVDKGRREKHAQRLGENKRLNRNGHS